MPGHIPFLPGLMGSSLTMTPQQEGEVMGGAAEDLVRLRLKQRGFFGTVRPGMSSDEMIELMSGFMIGGATKKVGKPKKPKPNFAGNINLKNLDISKEAKNAIREAASRNDDFLKARRGEQSYGETVRLADEMGISVDSLLKGNLGEAFTAERALGSRQVLAAASEELVKKARKAIGGSDKDLFNFKKAMTEHAAIQEHIASMTAEAGRTLSQFNIAATGEVLTRAIKEIVEAGTGRGGLEGLAKKMVELDGPGLAKFTREASRATKSDMILELWLNSLLSGPTTQSVNLLSNKIFSFLTIPEHFLAAGFSKIRGRPIEDKVFFRETVGRMFGFVEGAKDGLALAAKAFRSESSFDPFFKIDLRRHQAIPSFRLRKGKPNRTVKIRGTDVDIPFTGEIQLGGKQIRIPGRALLAGDEFFKSIGSQMEVNSLAIREGLRAGLKGDALTKFIREAKANPSDSIKMASIDAARYVTFTKPLGSVGQRVLATVNEVPILRVIAPFIRTPANIVKAAGERLGPLPLLSKNVRANLKKGGAVSDIQLSRMVMGSMIGATVVTLAGEEVITGGGPTDPRARQLWLQNNKPYSFRFGDSTYSYSRFEPMGILFGISADLHEISGEITDGNIEKIAKGVLASIAKNLTSKTYLRGISQFVEAASDPDRYLQNWLNSMLGTLIPTGVAQVARSEDPILRDVRTVMDKLKSRIPGYSETLPARRNLWGETIILGVFELCVVEYAEMSSVTANGKALLIKF